MAHVASNVNSNQMIAFIIANSVLTFWSFSCSQVLSEIVLFEIQIISSSYWAPEPQLMTSMLFFWNRKTGIKTWVDRSKKRLYWDGLLATHNSSTKELPSNKGNLINKLIPNIQGSIRMWRLHVKCYATVARNGRSDALIEAKCTYIVQKTT